MAWPLALDDGTQALVAALLSGMVAVHALAPLAWWGVAILVPSVPRVQQGAVAWALLGPPAYGAPLAPLGW
jgi:hypothetical protein